MAEIAGGAGNPGGGEGGGQPSGQPGAGGGQPGGTPSPAPGGNPGVGGQPGGGQPGGKQQFVYEEDRSKWVHPDALRNRLNEAKAAHQKELERLQGELERERQRIRALSGLENKSPEDAEIEAVRQALFKVEPRLAKLLEKLDDEKLERVLAAAESGDVVRQTTEAYWNRHAEQMLADLKSIVSEKTGLELTDRQSERLAREYTVMVQRAALARQRAIDTQDPTYDFQNDAVARNARGDRKLLEEFAAEFLEDWYEPVKKQATSAQVRRMGRPVPTGGRQRQTITQGPPQIDYNNEDEFKKALLAARQQG